MISLKPTLLPRYAHIAKLLIKHGHRDIAEAVGLPTDKSDTGDGEGRPEELAADLEERGPTFVKLGQLLSTRPDLLPPPYLRALARLQDHVEPVAWPEMREVIESDLGIKISTAFESFNERPLAAASLSQVYEATLRSGAGVAVKVLRPGARDEVPADLQAITELAQVLERHSRFGRRYGFVALAESLQRVMSDELDLRKEADAARRLGENLGGFKRFVVPQPIEGYIGANVLTMQYVSGVKITDLSGTAFVDLDRRGLVTELFDAYLQQILEDGFFHADPHPGNLFLTPGHSIALLDCGMVVRVDPRTRERLVKMIFAIGEGRGEDAARAAEQIGKAGMQFDEDGFRRQIRRIVAEHQNLSVEQMRIGRALIDIQCAAGDADLDLGHEITMLGKTLMNLDQIVETLDPTFDPTAALRERGSRFVSGQAAEDLTLSGVLRSAVDGVEFMQKLPERLNRIMDLASENKLKMTVDAIDENQLLAGFQKIANRITIGLLLASVVIGASLMMNIESDWTLFGYPAIAMVFFLIAAIASVVLAAKILLSDRT